MEKIEIRYRRRPDQVDVYVQDLVVDRPDCKVTLLERYETDRPLRVGQRVILEAGAPIVWFVFPGAWHDIGRFHLQDGTFTGYYANLIMPAQLDGTSWDIEDLLLDIWLDREGSLHVLDRDEFDEAVNRRWIDAGTADRVRREVERLLAAYRAGQWPPPVVREYDLTRVRQLAVRRS